MGLVAFGEGLLAAGARFLGIGGARAVTGGAGTFASRAVAAARGAGPAIAGGFAGGAAFEGGARLLRGAPGGLPVPDEFPPLAGGLQRATFVTLDDGSQVLVSTRGTVARPQIFLPAGAKLPAGATVVSISPDGNLFGIRRARRRRTFQGEVDRCKNTIQAADRLLAAVRKKK